MQTWPDNKKHFRFFRLLSKKRQKNSVRGFVFFLLLLLLLNSRAFSVIEIHIDFGFFFDTDRSLLSRIRAKDYLRLKVSPDTVQVYL